LKSNARNLSKYAVGPKPVEMPWRGSVAYSQTASLGLEQLFSVNGLSGIDPGTARLIHQCNLEITGRIAASTWIPITLSNTVHGEFLNRWSFDFQNDSKQAPTFAFPAHASGTLRNRPGIIGQIDFATKDLRTRLMRQTHRTFLPFAIFLQLELER
jgi:hypothetical protein